MSRRRRPRELLDIPDDLGLLHDMVEAEVLDVTPRQVSNERAIIPEKQRTLMLAVRQALLIALRAVEDYLEMPQSVPPKRR